MLLEISGNIWQNDVPQSVRELYSWVSLGYFAVNLGGGQPKMY